LIWTKFGDQGVDRRNKKHQCDNQNAWNLINVPSRNEVYGGSEQAEHPNVGRIGGPQVRPDQRIPQHRRESAHGSVWGIGQEGMNQGA
jgi:hypothetical protein